MAEGPLRFGSGGRVLFFCPGCENVHTIQYGQGDGPRWGYNDDPASPTFTPSILVTGCLPLTDEQADKVMAGEIVDPCPMRCHSYITDGQIRFLDDCSHALAGKTVPLPEYREPWQT